MDPLLFSGYCNPEAVCQASGKVHGMCRHIPRLIDGGHIPSPDVDQVVQDLIQEQHVIQLVVLECRDQSLEHQVVRGQLVP